MASTALLFTDLVDSTLLAERLGDARAAQLWTAHDRRARDLLALHRGREIDRSDGFFAIFDDAAAAAAFALSYQRAAGELGLSARAGIHVGAVALRANDAADVARGAKPIEVEGLAKPFAARVMALARGGQTLASAAARDALADAALPEGAEIESHGHYRLKGVGAPVELFEIGLRGMNAFEPPPDGDKAYRVVADASGLWQPLREVRHNLAAERDAFVGRSAELRALAQRLDAGARLLTVAGPGGTGKTRLVTRYARAWLGDWPGGVALCDLSEARSPEGIHHAVALALGVPLLAGDATAQLGHAIAARGRCLVVLDNFEQVAAHAPATLGRWLDSAANAAFVVTSRERLQLPGEEVFAVEPLALADEAIELFAVRARAQRPGFEIGPADRAAVAEIVRLLDGLPLAIELAAARVRVLSPPQIVARLQDRFRLLAGARGAAARQATLKAAIDWSWDLLAPWEQAALAQCSVFQGGFTLDAAEQVIDLSAWPDAGPVMDTVQALLDKSLLRHWPAAGPPRHDIAEPYFGMYISIHEYAAARLEACGPGAARAAQQRHGSHYARCGTDDALDALSRHGGVALLHTLAVELDNLVAACRRAIERGDAGAALATLRAAWEVLGARGPFEVAAALAARLEAEPARLGAGQRAWAAFVGACAAERSGAAADALARNEVAIECSRAVAQPRLEGFALLQRGRLAERGGRVDEAREQFERVLAASRIGGDRRVEALALEALGNHVADRGDLTTAAGHLRDALAIHLAEGDRRAEAIALHDLAIVEQELGETASSRARYESALEIKRALGDRVGEALVLGNLATLFDELGLAEQARSSYLAAAGISREVGDRVAEAFTLGNLVELCADQGALDEAMAHQAKALAVMRELGSRRELGVAQGRLGRLLELQGRHEAAQSAYGEAITLLRAVGNSHNLGALLGDLGALLARRGDRVAALAALGEGEDLLRTLGKPLALARLLCQRGQCDLAGGERGAAQAALVQAEEAAASLGVGPASELGREIALLRAALAA